jgi:hypothetical protein
VNVSVRAASPEDADTIAEMVGELLAEIMRTIGVQAFHFDRSETRERTRQSMENRRKGIYFPL